MRSVSDDRSWLRRRSSTPVMPGIRWSVTITATSSAASTSSAAAPPPARSTRNSAASTASSESSTRGSSSTMRTVACSRDRLPRSARRRRRRGPEREDLVQHLAVANAFQPGRAELAIPYQTIDAAERHLVRDDVNAEEPRHPLDAGGRDDRTAHDDQLAAAVGADGARHHAARGDADTDVEGRPPLGAPAEPQRRHRRHHVERRADGGRGGVIARLRDAKERDDLVADELLDGAAVPEDHVDHLGEVLVEERDHDRRRRALREAGEARDVGEEHRAL